MNKINFIFILLLNLIFSQNIFANAIKYPLVEIDNYSTADYNAYPQNWGVTQTQDGKIFFSNQQGVIVFDGIKWKFINTKEEKPARSIVTGVDGKVIVGTVGDFGELIGSNKSRLKYKTLVPDNNNILKGDIVYQVLTLQKNYILARTKKGIFELKNNILTKLPNPQKLKFGFMTYINKELYVFALKKGIYKFTNNKFILIPGTQVLNEKSKQVYFMNGIKEHLFIVTRRSGIYILKNDFLKKINVTNKLFNKSTLYRAIQLKNGTFAIGSYDGLFILNKNFKVTNHFNHENGLIDDNVRSIFEDIDGNLWVGLNNGISKIKLNSPIRHFSTYKSRINGRTRNAEIFNDTLYVATSNGIRKSVISNNHPRQFFQEVDSKNIQTQVWGMLASDNKLFVASNLGLGFIDNNDKYVQFVDRKVTGSVYFIKRNSFLNNYLTITAKKGVFLVSNLNSQNILNLNSEKGSVWEVAEIKDKKEIWYRKLDKGVYKVSFLENNNEKKQFQITKYTNADGLPSNTYRKHHFFEFNNNLFIGTQFGTFKFNNKLKKFVLDQTLSFKQNDVFSKVQKTKKLFKNKYWFQIDYVIDGKRTAKFISIDDNLNIEQLPFDKLGNNFSFKFLPYTDKVIISHSNGIGIVDKKPIYPKANGKVLINQLSINNILIHDYAPLKQFLGGDALLPKTFNADQKNFRFSISGTDFSENNGILFRYKLENFDDFSSWTNNSEITYTNLKSGNYVLKVEAKNKLDSMLMPYEYSFTIKPPWWETTYFYVGEILFFILLLLVTAFSKTSTRGQKFATAMTFVVIIVFFEFLNMFIDPLLIKLTGGIPIFDLLSKVALGLLLQPIERLASKLLDMFSDFVGKKRKITI